MIGYKATDKDGKCRGFLFEVGKTYTKDTKKEDLECCTDKVFHFCRELFAIEKESDYKLSESRLFEIIAGDYVKYGDKYGTNSITILREITGDEKKMLINSGNHNSGYWNSGNCNSGDWNSGNCNSGDRNSGYCNSGNRNSGYWNSGNRNSGNSNSGNRNSGNRNSGNSNSGNHNSGYWNSGNCNSGDWNSGNCNSGNWNSGNCNSGYFNSNTPAIRIFNKDTTLQRDDMHFPDFLYFDLTLWVSHDTATDEEKETYKKEIEICGGFLKTLDYKDAFKIAYDKASKEEHIELFKLPNFDCSIFEEISGINVKEEYQEWMKGDKKNV